MSVGLKYTASTAAVAALYKPPHSSVHFIWTLTAASVSLHGCITKKFESAGQAVMSATRDLIGAVGGRHSSRSFDIDKTDSDKDSSSTVLRVTDSCRPVGQVSIARPPQHCGDLLLYTVTGHSPPAPPPPRNYSHLRLPTEVGVMMWFGSRFPRRYFRGSGVPLSGGGANVLRVLHCRSSYILYDWTRDVVIPVFIICTGVPVR